jgi:hypothetical protein
VDERLEPYFAALRARSEEGGLMAGYKFIRGEDTAEEPEAAPAEPDEAQPLFFWFFFPIAGRDLVAWEATTGTGRATYFFRATKPVETAVQHLTACSRW